jgi:tol-pal system protein YbgF
MRAQRNLFSPLLLALALAAATPAFGVSKEIVQLQTQVQSLQDQMARMQQSFDERMGVMRSLVEQQTDSVNKLATNVDDLRKGLQQQHNDGVARNDQLSGQVQALNDSLDELKARLAKVSKQLDDMTSTQQNLQPGGAPSGPGSPNGPGAENLQAPPPDVLYNNALRDYNAGKFDLAVQEFGDYLRYYPNTDLAGNAQFYLADIEYRQGNYTAAVKDYDKVLEQYPGGSKTPAAQLKKGMALIQLGQKDAGKRELNSLIQRYPHSIEANTARDQLKKLAPTTTGSKSRSF